MTVPDYVLLYIFFAGVLMSVVWRFAGFLIASGLSENGPVILWVKYVSTALVSGLIARLVVFSPGALADIALHWRLSAFAFGVYVFFLAKRHLGLGVFAGIVALIALGLPQA